VGIGSITVIAVGEGPMMDAKNKFGWSQGLWKLCGKIITDIEVRVTF
jgi:hypothetical protein